MATTWLCRASVGNDNYGGTSPTLLLAAVDGVTNGTNTFTSATGGFTSAMIGQAIRFVNAGTEVAWRFITAVNSSTSLTFSGATIAAATGLNYYIGGALQTLARLINYTSTPFAAGDSVWLGAGHYRGQIAFQTAGVVNTTTLIAGDVTGLYTGDPGEAILSCSNPGDTSGSTVNAAQPFSSWSTLCAKAATALHWYTFQDLTVLAPTLGGSSTSSYPACGLDFLTNNVASQGIILQRLTVYGPTGNNTSAFQNFAGIALYVPSDTGAVPASVLNCLVLCATAFTSQSAANPSSTGATCSWCYACLLLGVPNSPTLNLLVRNCLFLLSGTAYNAVNLLYGGACIQVVTPGTSTQHGGGVQIYGCTLIGASGLLMQNYPSGTWKVYGCAFLTPVNSIFTAGGSNLTSFDVRDTQFWGGLKPAVSTTGTVEASTRPLLFDIGQSALRKGPARPFLTPLLGASIVGVGARTTALPSDFMNQLRQQNPQSTTQSTPGYMEPYAPGMKETTPTNVHNGTASVRLQGFSTHSFQLPVDAQATTLSLYAAYDASYGTPGTNCDFPAIRITDGAECGVADQLVAMTTGNPNTFQQINLNFTPTAKGILTVQLISRAASANGLCWFDD